MTTVAESSQRAKRIAWMVFGLTVAAWLVAGGMRIRRPVIESVMNGGEEFGARLRQEVDLDDLRADLIAVVDQTMRPTTASLWLLRGDGDR